MNVVAAFLAESISINDGVVDVRRGWPEWWSVESVPGEMELLVGVVVDLDQRDIGAELVFDFAFRQNAAEVARGRFLLTPERAGDFVAGVPFHHPFWFKMSGVPVSEVGPCEIAIESDGTTLAVIPFVLRLKP